MGDILNCRVPSDKEELQLLHEVYGWVPGRDNIRPNPALIEHKHKTMDKIEMFYETGSDYILETVFGLEADFAASGKLFVPESAILFAKEAKLKKLADNEFPYALPEGTNHAVMWYMADQKDVEDEEVNKDIAEGLEKRLGHEEFDFCWYLNPKMTVPGVYHVQVFWRER